MLLPRFLAALTENKSKKRIKNNRCMKKNILTDIALYLVVFILIQFGVNIAAGIICQTHSFTPTVMIATTIVSNVATIAIFAWRRWTPVSGKYIASRPWFTLFWVACLAVGASAPLSFLMDEVGLEMPQSYQELFKSIIGHDAGYLAVGVLAPVAEEMLFRGAILRRLLEVMDSRREWIAVAVTAALFGIVHLNVVQGVNAFVLGLLLGWMYVRTRSIVPGVVFHIVNNTIAFVVCRLFPGSADMTIREFYGGDMKRVAMAVVFSLMIFAAALYQLYFRLEKKPE